MARLLSSRADVNLRRRGMGSVQGQRRRAAEFFRGQQARHLDLRIHGYHEGITPRALGHHMHLLNSAHLSVGGSKEYSAAQRPQIPQHFLATISSQHESLTAVAPGTGPEEYIAVRTCLQAVALIVLKPSPKTITCKVYILGIVLNYFQYGVLYLGSYYTTGSYINFPHLGTLI